MTNDEGMTKPLSAFFIVGPTANGKSELAADVAAKIDAEIVSADAFQIYQGFNLLTAKPDRVTVAKAPHYLIGSVPLSEEMNAEKFRRAALRTTKEVHARGKLVVVVGGTGLYVKALTHGLAATPTDRQLRAELSQLSLDELRGQLSQLDPETAGKIDMNNRRRLVRALEICLLSGKPVSAQRTQWETVEAANAVVAAVSAASSKAKQTSDEPLGTAASTGKAAASNGVFVFRERDELYERINRRVEAMFENGVVEEVVEAAVLSGSGQLSSTAAKMIGLHEIQELLDGKMSNLQCIAAIQQATRRYAKRQLTWFRRQTNFEPLNLSLLRHDEAVEWISRKALSFAPRDD